MMGARAKVAPTALLLLIALMLPGCGTRWEVGSGDGVRITLWYSLGGRYSRPLLDIVDAFNSSQDSINVVTSYQGSYGPSFRKILASVVAENPPTLAQVVVQQGPRLVEYGTVLSLEPWFAADSSMRKDQFFPELLRSGTFDGQLYSLPLNASTQVLYYNRDLFRRAGLDPDAPPETWDEMRAAAAKLGQLTVTLADGRETRVIGLRIDVRDWDVERIIAGWGGRIYNDTFSRVAFNSPEVLAGLRFLRSMVDDGIADARSSNESDIAGVVGMVMRSTGSLEYLKQHVRYDLGVAPQPTARRRAVPLGGGNLFLFSSADSAQRNAAWTFLKYLYRPENQMRWAAGTGYMAPVRAAYQSGELQDLLSADPRRRVTYRQLPDGITSPQHGSYKEINDELIRYFKDTLRQNLDPQEALDILEVRCNKIIADYY